MNSRLLRILVLTGFLLAVSLLSQDVRAASFTAQSVTSTNITIPQSNYQINITVNNTDSTYNITEVNITITGFTFISGSNSTTASNTTFSSTSDNLTWSNTSSEGFIANGTAQNFILNVSVPSIPGYYNFTVNVLDTSVASNSTNITYTLILHNLTFSNLSAMQNSTNISQNLTYLIKIKNDGAPLQEQYNLTVVNCSNTSQSGSNFGILNASFTTLDSNASVAVELNVSSTVGSYSSCILAKHWNGIGIEENITFNSSRDGVMLSSTFNGNITPSNIYWTSTGGQNPFAGGNITVYSATISNTGSINFAGNITVYLLWDGVYSSQNVSTASISAGSSYNASFSNITGITNGLHNLTIWLDPANSVPETNKTDNNLTTQVFVGYNVTVLSIVRQNGTNNAPNTSINITVSVKYTSGTAVTNLNKENFTISDIYNGSFLQTLNYLNSTISTTFNSSMNASGIYWFNITSYNSPANSDTKPGTHNIIVQAMNNESNNAYSGNSSGSDYYYLIAPRLVVTLTAPSGLSVNEGNSRAITVNISNTGTDIIYNISITATDDSEFLTVPSNPSCTTTSLSNGSYLLCSSLFSAVTSAVSGNEYPTITVTAYGVHNYSGSPLVNYTIAGTIQLTIVNVDDSGGTTPTDGGGGTTAKSCTTDSQCSANESCSATKKCATISCPNGEILDHLCINFSYKINITSFGSAISAVSGGSNSTKVTVKNTGANTFTAKLEVSISNVAATVTPVSYSLGAGESYQFTVNFTVPNTTTIGDFSGTFKAYVSTSSSTYESRAFKFTVFPKEETKTEINVSYQELSSLLSSIIANLTQMKASGKYNQSVLSSIENLISAANSTLLDMKSAMDSDNYVYAQSLISEVNTSIDNVRAQMEGAQIEVITNLPAQYGIWFWVAVAVIIIFVVGFFIYMFYPSQHVGYHPEKGFAPPGAKEGFGEKIKRIFRRKKKDLPSPSISSIAQSVAEPQKDEEGHYDSFHYSEGYKKEKPYDYQYSDEGVKGFFQKLRRKKSKKTTPQMHLDQFAGQTIAEQKRE